MPILKTQSLKIPKQYITVKFSTLYENVEMFGKDCIEFYTEKNLDGNQVKNLYYLLLGNFSESHIAYTNTMQFKIQMFNEINRLYPTILEYDRQQKELRTSTIDDLIDAGESITNAGASNTSNITTDAPTGSTQLASQVTNKQKYGKFTAKLNKLKAMQYGLQQDLIKSLKRYFIMFLEPQLDLYFYTEDVTDKQ